MRPDMRVVFLTIPVGSRISSSVDENNLCYFYRGIICRIRISLLPQRFDSVSTSSIVLWLQNAVPLGIIELFI